MERKKEEEKQQTVHFKSKRKGILKFYTIAAVNATILLYKLA